MCKSVCELVLGLIIVIFAFWQTAYSQWIVVIAAIILIVHSFTCKKCFMHNKMPAKMMKK